MNEKLAARVEAVNLAHQTANNLFPIYKEAFKPFIGHKIQKIDGSLMNKVKKSVDSLDISIDKRVNVYCSSNNYSLAYTVKSCVSLAISNSVSIAYYHDVTMYIGEMLDRVLIGLNEPVLYRTDYSVQEIEKARSALKIAQQALDEAKEALFPFGEFDN